MSNNNKTPAIRFKGFTDTWEQRELGEIATEIIAGSDVDKSLLCEEGNCPVIANALTNDGIIGYYKNEYRVKAPAVTVTGRGDVGHAKARNDDFTPVVRLLSIKSEHDIYFLENAINAIKIVVESTGVPQLTVPQLSKNVIFYPNSAEEEMKIGTYFRNLDSLITLHQRKCDKLIQFKAAMLQKMFPQNGADKPEIRFKGFTDAWEQRRFGELGSVAMCKRVFKEQTLDTGEIPFYKIGTFGGEPDAFISRELFEEYKCKFSYPEIGDMLISASGTIGRTVEYTGKDEYFQDSNIVWFKHNDRIDNSFLKCLYSIVKWSGIEGSTIKRLYNDNFLKTEFMLPCVEEQQQIGNYFRNLDNLITLHQRKCDKYKSIKAGLIRKLFP